MRRIVRDLVATALARQRSDLERFVAGHLEVPDSFPLLLGEPEVVVRELGTAKIVPRGVGDFATVDVVVRLHVAVTARASRREGARGVRTTAVPDSILGLRTFVVDVELSADGAAAAGGYDLTPRRARLTAWCGG